MKRFSVLLVVVVFLMPLVVYGLSGNFERIATKQNLQEGKGVVETVNEKEKLVHTSSQEEQMIQQQLPHPEDLDERMFLFPDPEGIKGIIKEINPLDSTIYLENAEYYNPRTESIETSDFTIKFQQDTTFVHDMQTMPDLNHLSPGQKVVCQGLINYQSLTVVETTHIFSGNYYLPDETMHVIINGHIVSRSDNTLTFIGTAAIDYDLGETFKVVVAPDTRCLRQKPSENQATQIQDGIIPDFVTSGTLVHGVAVFTYSGEEGIALDLVFFENE